jgi:hypothetical protein
MERFFIKEDNIWFKRFVRLMGTMDMVEEVCKIDINSQ